MRLPFAPPLAPMLSSAADALPGGEGWQLEPKWDGFRTLVFRDGDEILLQSRDEKPMNRYFPELIAPLAATLSERCVVDGEIVIVGVGGLDFETLLLRIHPAASRVKLLSAQAPASFVAWDLLALGDDDLRNAPLAVRRERLEHVLAGAASPVHLSPATRDRALAADWVRRLAGAGLAGVVGKRLDAPYRAGERTMIKVKHERTAVCGVAYDHMQGTRFRHAAKFLRWRPDKRPQDCRYDQLEVTPAYELDRVFGARDRSQPCAPASQGR